MSVAITAYARRQAEGLTGRALEAAIFERCASEMQILLKQGRATRSEIHRAIERNRNFWAMCLASAADPESPLPEELKINIGQLAVFMEAQMRKAIADQDVTALEPMVYINRNLAAGLRGKPGKDLPPLP